MHIYKKYNSNEGDGRPKPLSKMSDQKPSIGRYIFAYIIIILFIAMFIFFAYVGLTTREPIGTGGRY